MKMRTRRRAYAAQAWRFQTVLWSRWKRKILAGLPSNVIQSLAAKGYSSWRIVSWATQPCVFVLGWPPPITMQRVESIRFAAACTCAAWDDRGEPAILRN